MLLVKNWKNKNKTVNILLNILSREDEEVLVDGVKLNVIDQAFVLSSRSIQPLASRG